MLKSLSISNYALITELNIDFSSGMTAITGETGAGKSIIMGALSLVQGQRADTRVIREGAPKTVVEACFEVGNYNLKTFFETNELDYSETTVVRREVSSNGKSRAFINDTPVSLNVLRDLSNRLLDIHSQNENLLLSTFDYQLRVVDAVADNQKELSEYQAAYSDWNVAKTKLSNLRKEADKQSADLDYLKFQLGQLDDAALIEGEQAELEVEQERLNHVEDIKLGLQQADYLLSREETNVLKSVKDIHAAIFKIKDFLPEGANWAERIDAMHIELKDIAYDVSNAQDSMEFNPERLEYIDNRLGLLLSIQKKFKADSVESLIEMRETMREQLNRIDSFDEILKEAENLVERSLDVLRVCADRLTSSRAKVIPEIEKYLVEELVQLGMPNVQFVISIKPAASFVESGNDDVGFLFSANKNRSVQLVAEIASGGEVSRLMLAVKSLLVRKLKLPTIIFDEIDTGVSGEIAGRMGDIMKQMGLNTQLIVITHLPQIAAKGNAHYRVYKDSAGNSTETFIQILNQDERIQELAGMLSGKSVTEAALMNARELLK